MVLIDFETLNSSNIGSVLEDCSTFSSGKFSIARAFYLHNIKGNLNQTLPLFELATGELDYNKFLESRNFSDDELAILREFRTNIETDLALTIDDKENINNRLLSINPDVLEMIRRDVITDYFPNLQEN